jgi:D-aminopeptidase
MTQEVNAAIEGAFAGGASEVIVNDSHSGMRNIIPICCIGTAATSLATTSRLRHSKGGSLHLRWVAGD